MKRWPITILAIFINGCATNITGLVKLENGNPIQAQGGKINISSIKSGEASESFIIDINDKGYFESETDVANGIYLVEPLIPGYTAKSIKITVKKDEDQHLEILAKPLPKPNSKIFKIPVSQPMDRGTGGVNLTPPKF